MGSSSFLNSVLNIVSTLTLNVVNGFISIPLTKLRNGAIFTDMNIPINFVDQSGNYQLGQGFGSGSVLSSPSFQQSPQYEPEQTQPPRTFPTFQSNGYQVPLGLNPASQYQTSAEAVRIIKMFEGLQQRAYSINGQKYIGYGHRLAENASTAYVSIDEAESLLMQDIAAAEGLVKGAVSGQIAQGQFDALVDFAFTLSPSNFKGSDVVQKFNSGDVAGAATALAQWTYVNRDGVVSKSLHLASRRTHNVHWLSMPIDVLPPPEPA